MTYRLVGQLDSRALSLVVNRHPQRIGASRSCALCLRHATVSRLHAEVAEVDGGVEIRDLGSKNGTFLGRKRISSAVIGDGTLVRLGEVGLRLELAADSDLELAVAIASDRVEPMETSGYAVDTDGQSPIDGLYRRTLPQLLALVAAQPDLTRAAQIVGTALAELLPASEITISACHDPAPGLLFLISDHSDSGLSHSGLSHSGLSHSEKNQSSGLEPAVVRAGGLELAVTFFDPGDYALLPVVDLAGELLALVEGLDQGATEQLPVSPSLPEPVTVDPAMRRIYEEAAQVAATDVGVLITGESGTGKEILARYLHGASRRAGGPFITVNCAALPHDLLEAELFGIESGVATGVDRREGRFELADGGTLFLDEIGDMSLGTQAMILRTVQEGEVFRIGATRPRKVMVRILAATNKDLGRLMAEGLFREDLFFRIATWKVEMPPLRRRRGDIANLAAFFLAREARRLGRRVRGISRAALEAMLAYDWPGNVRQLENEMARAIAFLSDGAMLDRHRLGAEVLAGPRAHSTGSLQERLAAFERQEIAAAMAASNGDTAAAATQLGIPRSTLYRKLHQLGLTSTKPGQQ